MLSQTRTIEAFNCVKAIANDVYQEFDADTIYIEQNGIIDVIKVEEIEECKHTPYKVTFINKFGALQDLWFFKRANLSLSTKKEEYTANTMSEWLLLYKSRHQKQYSIKEERRC